MPPLSIPDYEAVGCLLAGLEDVEAEVLPGLDHVHAPRDLLVGDEIGFIRKSPERA
jgi:hypothetical protein